MSQVLPQQPSERLEPPPNDHRDRIRAVNRAVQNEEQRLRARHPWLNRQDLLGMLCFLASLAAMAGVAMAYVRGGLSPWLAVPLMALPMSILHELEHDLIHNLFFRRQKWVQDGMFGVIWLAKLSLNPWVRRELHLRHHKTSGQPWDIEERLIGLGMRSGLLRMLVTLHPGGAFLLLPRLKREIPDFKPVQLLVRSLPAILIFFLIWRTFFAYSMDGILHPEEPFRRLPEWGLPWARALFILWVAPGILRQACLVLMSSYSHYFGDIPEHDVFAQNQILRHWSLIPFQLFCFNFGATHIIHHYVVDQPFYLRQMVAPVGLAELERQGARVNDFGTVARDNRRTRVEAGQAVAVG